MCVCVYVYIYIYIHIYIYRYVYVYIYIKNGLNVPFPIFCLNSYIALLIKILHLSKFKLHQRSCSAIAIFLILALA